MKAYLTEKGCLRVVPETTTEKFALNHWSELSSLSIENGESRVNGKFLVVGPGIDDRVESIKEYKDGR